MLRKQQPGYDFQNLGQNWGVPQTAPLHMGSPDVPQTDITGALLSKAMLDGTDIFGANSQPGAFNMPGVNSAAAPGGGGLMNFLFGANTKDSPGAFGSLVGGAGALANAFMSMKQYGLAKDTLAENKKQFNMNFDAQRSTTNASLEDRQRARVASNAGAYQSPSDYMNKYGIK